MIKFFLSFFLLLFSFEVFAQNTLLENLEQKEKKNWRLSFSATHVDGFGDERMEPGTFFTGLLSYQIRERLALDMSATFRKVYYVDFSGEDEIKPSDPWVSLRHSFKTKFLEGAPILSYGLALPVSEYSHRNDIYTKAYISGSDSWMALGNDLTITLGISSVYYVNGYTTAQTSSTSRGGSLLPQFDASGSLTVGYALGKALGLKNKILKSSYLSFYGSYTRTTFEKFDISPTSYTDFRGTDDSYNLSVTYLFSPYKNFFASVGYGHDASIETQGRLEYYTFDNLASTWRIGLRYARRF